MEHPWFKRKSVFYIPISGFGWLLFVLLIAYWVYSFVYIDNRSHSVSDTLINFVINALFGAFIYQLIAYLSVKKFKNSTSKKV